MMFASNIEMTLWTDSGPLIIDRQSWLASILQKGRPAKVWLVLPWIQTCPSVPKMGWRLEAWTLHPHLSRALWQASFAILALCPVVFHGCGDRGHDLDLCPVHNPYGDNMHRWSKRLRTLCWKIWGRFACCHSKSLVWFVCLQRWNRLDLGFFFK